MATEVPATYIWEDSWMAEHTWCKVAQCGFQSTDLSGKDPEPSLVFKGAKWPCWVH